MIDQTTSPPEELSAGARQVWNEIVPELLSWAWFDPVLDRVLVIGYCTLQARAQAIRVRFDAASSGHEADLLALIEGSPTDQVFNFANVLVLTPVARSALRNPSLPWAARSVSALVR